MPTPYDHWRTTPTVEEEDEFPDETDDRDDFDPPEPPEPPEPARYRDCFTGRTVYEEDFMYDPIGRGDGLFE